MPQAPAPPEFDVVIYGGTSAGVIAAVQARRLGKTAVIVGPDFHLGGLSSGGLGFTDTGNKAVIGGLSREFYQRVWRTTTGRRIVEVAEAGGVRKQGAGNAGHRRRAADDVDLRAARRGAGVRGFRQ